MRFLALSTVAAATVTTALAMMVIGTVPVAAQSTPATSVAQPVKQVVELFTSQGCSSCPSADALFVNYTKRPDILALSFSVDYWDYLGWRDTLASPAFTARQKHYAKARGDGQVYTPQIVVNGGPHAVGSQASQIDRLIGQGATATRVWVPVAFTADRLALTAPTPQASARPNPATVWLVRYVERADVEIRRGENAGKTVTYHNVVRSIAPLTEWDCKTDLSKAFDKPLTADTKPGERLAVLVQEHETGRLLGAARLE